MKLKKPRKSAMKFLLYSAKEGQAWKQITNGILRRIKWRKRLLWTTPTTKPVQTNLDVRTSFFLIRNRRELSKQTRRILKNHVSLSATLVMRKQYEVISAPTPSTMEWQTRRRSSRRTMPPSQLQLQTSARPIKYLVSRWLEWGGLASPSLNSCTYLI